MDTFDSLSASEKAEATELQRMIAIEQQKAQFQAQVGMPTAKMLICYIWETVADVSRAPTPPQWPPAVLYKE